MAQKRYLARIYRPTHQQQKLRHNGSLIGCTETSFAMMVDAITFGGCLVDEAEVRALSNEPIESVDPNSPGLNLRQIDDVAKLLHVKFSNREGRGEGVAQMDDWLSQNRRVLAQLWLPDLERGAGAIGHAILIQAKRRDRYLINDPRKTDAQWKSAAVVQKAMTTFARMTHSLDGVRFGIGVALPYVAKGKT